MGRKNTPVLNVSAQQELEKAVKTGKTHAFRKRCQLVLLRAEGAFESRRAQFETSCFDCQTL